MLRHFNQFEYPYNLIVLLVCFAIDIDHCKKQFDSFRMRKDRFICRLLNISEVVFTFFGNIKLVCNKFLLE